MGNRKIEEQDRRLLPRGVHFPFTKRADGIPSADGPPNIFVSNVAQILLTTLGERVMRPTFGSGLKMLLFTNIEEGAEAFAKRQVLEAISLWEQRVFNINVETSFTETTLGIKVSFFSPLGPGEVEVSFEKT